MRDYYHIDDLLGKGAYGEVHICTYVDPAKSSTFKDKRAVKIMNKAFMEENDIKGFRNEVSCLLKWRDDPHPSLLQMYHYFEDPKRLLLVTDICDGGELFDVIDRQPHGRLDSL